MLVSTTALVAQESGPFAPPSKAVVALVQEAIQRFALIVPGDRVAVGLSGGKDSWLLWSALRTLQQSGAIDCELGAVHLLHLGQV